MRFILTFVLLGMLGSWAQADSLDACAYSCSTSCQYAVDSTLSRVQEIQRRCGFGNPNPPPGPVSRVALYHSDSCSSSLMGYVSSYTDCKSLTYTENVWGVLIDGRCFDISDMPASRACVLLKEAQTARVLLYHSDSCSGNLQAAIQPWTNCNEIAENLSENVWAIMVDGRCQDISDMSPRQACEQFKNAAY